MDMKRDRPTEIKAFLSGERRMLITGYDTTPIQVKPP
jgi:hypothetical protein